MRRGRGFTLVELLLVIVIMMVTAGLALPRFARSYQGAKLRSSMRTILMANRYARATAVLQQKQTALLLDQEKGEIEVVSVAGSGEAERNRFLDQRANRTGVETLDAAPEEGGDAQVAVASELVRPLAEDVQITLVEMASEDQSFDGIYWINYYPNGMCDKYTVRLRDKHDKEAEMKVDPLSGKAEIDYLN